MRASATLYQGYEKHHLGTLRCALDSGMATGQLEPNDVRRLAYSSCAPLRYEASCSAVAPAHILEHLATDPVTAIRREVAKNPRSPVAVLAHLRLDPMRSVRRAARSAAHEVIRLAAMPLPRVDAGDAIAVCERFAKFVGVAESEVALTILRDWIRDKSYFNRADQCVFDVVEVSCMTQTTSGFSSAQARLARLAVKAHC